MKLQEQIAKHFREVFNGGNWTGSNLKDILADVSLEEAITRIYSLNSIATLVFHINYYLEAITNVLQGQPLNAKDELSFNHEPVKTPEEWENMKLKLFTNAEILAVLIEKIPESLLWKDFKDNKYGNFYRNLEGNTEHIHYHLGQIAILKKILRSNATFS